MHRLRLTAAASAILVAALLVAASAQDARDARRPPQLPALARPIVTWADPARSTGGLEFSDLTAVALAAERGDLVFQAEFQRELFDGMFTCVEIDFDCDGRRADLELGTRASVGSRFRPTSFVPRAGEADPIRLIRASWLSPFDESASGEVTRRGMTNRAQLMTPQAGGTSLRFLVPVRLPMDSGVRGSTTPPAIRIRAITTCGDHPLAFDYDAIGEGRAIQVDGTTSEWSGGPYVEDAGDELHAAVRHMDLRAVWCEHGPDKIFVRIDFDRTGFGRARGDADVAVNDAAWVELQPRGAAYMDDVLVAIPATDPRGDVGSVRFASGAGTVEIAIPRDPKQTAFRVAVWSQAERIDTLTGDWIPLPPEAMR